MSIKSIQGAKNLFGFRPPTIFETAPGALLPEAYRKFWYEWREKKPSPVHYIPKPGKYERNEITGIVTPVQNVPFPTYYPPEHNFGIWGGEAVIKGFQKRTPYKRRVPHFWVPILKKSVVFSAILNEYFSLVVTDRTISLIHENHGFDHYILKTPACDLKSTLALNLKRKMLQELEKGCPTLQSNLIKQKSILNEYKHYLENYTSEEIEWYGLTFDEAVTKMEDIIESEKKVIPDKIKFRTQLIEYLKNREENKDVLEEQEMNDKSWMSKLNPFSKKDS